MDSINTVLGLAKKDDELLSPFFTNVSLRDSNLRFLFDTGAVVTILPVSDDTVQHLYNLNPQEVFVEDHCIILFSASKHATRAYFHIFNNVEICGLKLENFCCYLTDETYAEALLGRDFIVSAGLNHAVFSPNFNLFAVADNKAYLTRCIKIFHLLHQKYLEKKQNGELDELFKEEINKQAESTRTENSNSDNVVKKENNTTVIINSSEHPKNVAASFRDFYDNKFPNIKDNN